MPNDIRVPPISDEKIRTLAQRTRLGLEFPIDIVTLIKSPKLQTINGLKNVKLLPEEDSEMEDDDGTTEHFGSKVLVRVKKSVLRDAEYGLARARFTLGHELGHVVLCHDRTIMSRKVGATAKNRNVKYIKPFESAERQANIFSAALFIDADTIDTFESSEQVSLAFGVSEEMAAIEL